MKFAILRVARRFGFDITRYSPAHDPNQRLRHALERRRITTLFDVGANVGQFGQMIRMAGYAGDIVSFEPLSTAYARLTRCAANDRRWSVAPRCAVAATSGVIEINISGNSQSSSVLPMLDRHIAGDPRSSYVGKESVPTITLAEYIERCPPLRKAQLGVKIDTQGFERDVLLGLLPRMDQVQVIKTEVSLVPLYGKDAIGCLELFQMMADWGFHCISIDPNFIDSQAYEVLQSDAIFVR